MKKKKTKFKKSTEQGNLFSKLDPKIFENNTCIISRLQSRSLTGRNPHIKIHKHFGDRLHLIWQAKINEMVAKKFIGHDEIIQNNIEIKKFCTDLQLSGLENLCSCISPNLYDPVNRDGKIEKCSFVYGLPRDVTL
jgi:hypothetical protein